MFIGTAALFIFGTLACLWHLRWMRRLPALSELNGFFFTDADCWLKPDVIVRAMRLAQSESVDHVTVTSGIAAPSLRLRGCHLM